MRTIYVTFMGLGLGLVLGALGGFLYLPIFCTIWGESYDGMGMILFTMMGATGGTIVGGALGVVIGLLQRCQT